MSWFDAVITRYHQKIPLRDVRHEERVRESPREINLSISQNDRRRCYWKLGRVRNLKQIEFQKGPTSREAIIN